MVEVVEEDEVEDEVDGMIDVQDGAHEGVAPVQQQQQHKAMASHQIKPRGNAKAAATVVAIPKPTQQRQSSTVPATQPTWVLGPRDQATAVQIDQALPAVARQPATGAVPHAPPPPKPNHQTVEAVQPLASATFGATAAPSPTPDAPMHDDDSDGPLPEIDSGSSSDDD